MLKSSFASYAKVKVAWQTGRGVWAKTIGQERQFTCQSGSVSAYCTESGMAEIMRDRSSLQYCLSATFISPFSDCLAVHDVSPHAGQWRGLRPIQSAARSFEAI